MPQGLSHLTSFMVVLFCSQRHSITLILLQGEEGRRRGQRGQGGEGGPKHLPAPGRSRLLVRSCPLGPAPPGIPGARGRPARPRPGPLCAGDPPGAGARAARCVPLSPAPSRLPPRPNQTTPSVSKRPRLAARRPLGPRRREGRVAGSPPPRPALQWAGESLRRAGDGGEKVGGERFLTLSGEGAGRRGSRGHKWGGGRVIGAGAGSPRVLSPGTTRASPHACSASSVFSFWTELTQGAHQWPLLGRRPQSSWDFDFRIYAPSPPSLHRPRHPHPAAPATFTTISC